MNTKRVATPNDPKLSDGGGQARRLPVVARWWRSLAAAVTGRSRSLQRMVRRCGVWIKDIRKESVKVRVGNVTDEDKVLLRSMSVAYDKHECGELVCSELRLCVEKPLQLGNHLSSERREHN